MNREFRSIRIRRDNEAERVFFAVTLLPPTLIAVVTLALALRSWPLLSAYPVKDLLLGARWKPDEGLFGFWPFITGTFWVTTVGVALAVPPCILAALYLSEYSRAALRRIAQPVLDLLAAIPPVVYGVWGLLAIVPFVENVAAPFSRRWLGFIPFFHVNQPTGFSVIAGGIVLAIMIAPLVISVVYEILRTVPEELRQASLAVGATRWQTIRRVILPKAMPGLLAAIVLGASRALGETIAVLMVVGNVAKVPTSLFDAAYPLPALIANNYGDMMSIRLYDAALLCSALILLAIILIFNVASTLLIRRVLGRNRS
ncbi:MAG: phosphate ABC transporter permease subunit PstC [Rectinemataceae bacterium]|jgi:phosphate transport system permease protein